MKLKKGVMNQIVSVAVMVLVISILFGLTFLVIQELKDQTRTQGEVTLTITNETETYINVTGDSLTTSPDALARAYTVVAIWGSYNQSNGSQSALENLPAGYNVTIAIANATISDSGVVTNASEEVYPNVSITYTYKSATGITSYEAVDDTESAGATIVDYLPLVFLALIFGAILMIVLKIILPYASLGKSMGEGF